MTLLQFMNRFVGKKVVQATRLRLRRDEEHFVYAVALRFGSEVLILKAESDNDTLSAHYATSINDWLQAQPESHALSVESCEVLSQFEGGLLTNVWTCQSDDDYVDAIDFGLGDLNYPTVKLFCITSEIHVMLIQRDPSI